MKTVVVLSQCAWPWVSEWSEMTPEERERDPTYAQFKEDAKEALFRDGLRAVWPDLEKYVIRTTIGTPLSTNTFLGTDIGECGGHGPTCDHYLVPDFIPYTPVKNLFMTGQDVLSLGVAGGSQSGYLTANAVAGYGNWQNALLQRDIVVDLGLPPLF
jgi:all-trans-retinol 13,14-reductase